MSSLQRSLPSYKRQGGARRLLRSAIFVIVMVFILVTVIQGFFIRTFEVRSVSMEPTIEADNIIVVSPLRFGKESPFSGRSFLDFARPSRGELVLVKPPYHIDQGFFGRILDHFVSFVSLGHAHFGGGDESTKSWESSLIVRRVIALGGDQVYMSDGIFYVKAAGTKSFVQEFQDQSGTYTVAKTKNPIQAHDLAFSEQMQVQTVAADQVFLAADNRGAGLDSRYWGAVDLSALRGEVLLRIWPFSDFGTLK